MTRDRTGELLPDPDTCDYCDRTGDVCRRIPGQCCGACDHDDNRPRLCCTGCGADHLVCARKASNGGRVCCGNCSHVQVRKVPR